MGDLTRMGKVRAPLRWRHLSERREQKRKEKSLVCGVDGVEALGDGG